MSDLFGALELELRDNETHRERRAAVRAKNEAINKFGSFLERGERKIRLAFIDDELVELAYRIATEENVSDARVYDFLVKHLAAEVAVTEPKKDKVDTPTGGPEGEKYKNTDKSQLEDHVDATTDINDLDAVLVEEVNENRFIDAPKRHKKEQVDLNSDTDKT